MFFRNRRVARATACLLLLELIGNIVAPGVSWAIMGPSQPEFTTYELGGASDMVNMNTGDFSFSVPVLNIPGPERSFSLPLTYKAGIQLEQEASWVGLGWSLNAGAISRTLNGYADDANNEPVQLKFDKKIDRGWTGGIPGVVDVGWNSITGYYGRVDLLGLASVGWDDNGVSGGDLVGIKYQAGDGFSIDPVRMVMAVYTIATLGAGSALSLAANIGIQQASSIVIGAGISMAGLGRLGSLAGFNNQPTRKVDDSHLFHDDYWNFYKNSTTENAYGSLYFGAMSENAQPNQSPINQYNEGPNIYLGSTSNPAFKARPFSNSVSITDNGNTFVTTASDIYQDSEHRDRQLTVSVSGINSRNNSYYETGKRPLSIAHDYFSVMGEGATGAIRPYRLDVGSISNPKYGVDVEQWGSSSYKLPHYKYMVAPFANDYKVGFRYENSLSNGYDYHQYISAAGKRPEGIDAIYNSNLSWPYSVSSGVSLVITDPRLMTDHTSPATHLPRPSSAHTGSPRLGLHNNPQADGIHTDRQMVQGKHVKWYSNREIKDLYASAATRSASDFLEFDTPVTSTSSNNTFREQLPPSGIGAFAVTIEDGTTYHYSLPVYQYKTYAESKEQQVSGVTIGELGTSTRVTGLPVSTNPTGGYATTWLLTAITSADYIDRNNSGTVDAGDWGGWVQFKYGKFSSKYKWRQPYVGSSYSDVSPTIGALAFTAGVKETYYLNSISTRSHTALFVKSVREDGRGHYNPGVYPPNPDHFGIDERYPSSSLRLDEIVLLDNETLAKLQTANGIRAANDPNPILALSNATSTLLGGSYADYALCATDNIDGVLDVHDIDGDARIRAYTEAHALKRIKFNYSYELCRGLPSSFAYTPGVPLPSMDEAHMSTGRSGKLTLRSVSFFGPTVNQTPTKIIPDFTFEYGLGSNPSATNPGYKKEGWDGFGMYNSVGIYDVNSHKPNRTDYPAPWSITKITSPLGATTEISYERDQYAHVSEFGTTRMRISNNNCSNSNCINTFTINPSDINSLGGPISTVLKQGQTIYVTGEARFASCQIGSNTVPIKSNRIYKHTAFQVVAFNQATNQITLSPSITHDGAVSNSCSNAPQGADLEFTVPKNVYGGDVRVARIITREGNNAYQVRYKYTRPGTTSADAFCNSTGVISKEPPFINRFERAANGLFDYPTTPVMYSRVTVLRGLFRNGDETDYETREIYSFITPSTDMITDNSPEWYSLPNSPGGHDLMQSVNNQTIVDVGRIGQPSAVQVFNRHGQQELGSSFNYASYGNATTSGVPNDEGIAGQGYYTEGLLNTEMLGASYKVNRSTKLYVPSVMASSRSTRNGVTIENSNILYDFYTGQVVETAFKNSNNEVYHSRSVPAYTKYPAMGPRGEGANNAHMLTQQTAFYILKERIGIPYDSRNFLTTAAVMKAGVQTWDDVWTNYRTINNSGEYADEPGSNKPIWRQKAAFQWQSSQLNPDGSYVSFVDYAWNNTTGVNAKWVKAGEIVRYDHYSHALESKDTNGATSAQKTGYNLTQPLVSANNAKFTEIAFSSAEDMLASNAAYLGGEVAIGSGGQQSSEQFHTGHYSNKVSGGNSGFEYRPVIGADVTVGNSYRLSVWVHSTNAQNGRLFAAIDGTVLSETSVNATETKKAGAWYRLNLTVPVPVNTPTGQPATGRRITFGCRNVGSTGTPIYLDDFRVSPLTASITSQVYEQGTNHLIYTLDNENLYTHYEYNSVGRLVRVYKETLDKPGKPILAHRLVKEYEVNYADMHRPTWVITRYECELNAAGSFTGYEKRWLEDKNPLNAASPAPAHWDPIVAESPACVIPQCEQRYNRGFPLPSRVRNNQCEWAHYARENCVPCSSVRDPISGQLIAQSSIRIYWEWPDNTPAGDVMSRSCADGACSGGGGGGGGGGGDPVRPANNGNTTVSPKLLLKPKKHTVK